MLVFFVVFLKKMKQLPVRESKVKFNLAENTVSSQNNEVIEQNENKLDENEEIFVLSNSLLKKISRPRFIVKKVQVPAVLPSLLPVSSKSLNDFRNSHKSPASSGKSTKSQKNSSSNAIPTSSNIYNNNNNNNKLNKLNIKPYNVKDLTSSFNSFNSASFSTISSSDFQFSSSEFNDSSRFNFNTNRNRIAFLPSPKRLAKQETNQSYLTPNATLFNKFKSSNKNSGSKSDLAMIRNMLGKNSLKSKKNKSNKINISPEKEIEIKNSPNLNDMDFVSFPKISIDIQEAIDLTEFELESLTQQEKSLSEREKERRETIEKNFSKFDLADFKNRLSQINEEESVSSESPMSESKWSSSLSTTSEKLSFDIENLEDSPIKLDRNQNRTNKFGRPMHSLIHTRSFLMRDNTK